MPTQSTGEQEGQEVHPHPEQERNDRVTEWWRHELEAAYTKCLAFREQLDKMVVKQLDMLSDKDVILSDYTELNRLLGTINQKILSFGMELAEELEWSASKSVVEIECGCDLKRFSDKEQINIISHGVLSASRRDADFSLAERGIAVVPAHSFFVFAVTFLELPKTLGAKIDADKLAKAKRSAPKLVEKTAESTRLRVKQWFSDYLLGALLNVEDSPLQESLWLQCKTQLASARDSRLKYLKSVRPAACSATPPEVRQVQVYDWWETERHRAYKLASRSSERVWENVSRSYGYSPGKSKGYHLEMEKACREMDNSLLTSAIEAIHQIDGRFDQPELLYRLASHEQEMEGSCSELDNSLPLSEIEEIRQIDGRLDQLELLNRLVSHEQEKSLRSELEVGMNTDCESTFDFLWDRAESKIDEFYDVWSRVSPR